MASGVENALDHEVFDNKHQLHLPYANIRVVSGVHQHLLPAWNASWPNTRRTSIEVGGHETGKGRCTTDECNTGACWVALPGF